MNFPGLVHSKEAALVLSLMFNAIQLAAIWRLWVSREALSDKITGMATDLVRELSRMMLKRED
ncbi:MAG: hypothetical protein GY714_10525 [Desulfobacterales bacterium]|nr:hypothetical protein [Desulfobacterales bacterium]